jgi:hypothetical protein
MYIMSLILCCYFDSRSQCEVMHYIQPSKALIITMVYSTYVALVPQTHTILEGIVLTSSRFADSEIRKIKGQKKCIIILEFKSIC